MRSSHTQRNGHKIAAIILFFIIDGHPVDARYILRHNTKVLVYFFLCEVIFCLDLLGYFSFRNSHVS